MFLTAPALAQQTGIPLAVAHKVLQDQTQAALRFRIEPWAWLLLTFPLTGYNFVAAAVNAKLVPLFFVLGAGVVWFWIGRALAAKPSRKIAEEIARRGHQPSAC